jgi:uncharacterized protein (DUF983 family)
MSGESTMINTGDHRFSLRAILRQRCSECGEGPIFAGALRMNDRCPACGYKFERGPGYFTGAMYFSYALGIPVIAAGVILGKLLIVPSWPLHWIVLVVWALSLPLVPTLFRYSRVLFIHFDRYFDPEGAGD